MVTVSSIKIKLFGKTETIYRAFKAGELVKCFGNKQRADEWAATQNA